MKSLNQIWKLMVWKFQEMGMLQGLGPALPGPILLNYLSRLGPHLC